MPTLTSTINHDKAKLCCVLFSFLVYNLCFILSERMIHGVPQTSYSPETYDRYPCIRNRNIDYFAIQSRAGRQFFRNDTGSKWCSIPMNKLGLVFYIKGYISDTVSEDDVVRIQYSSLPYPAFSHRGLESEYMHYKSTTRGRTKTNATIPYDMVFGFTLERINHFLFKGRNDFR